MPAGVYVRNQNSVLQIDENYRNIVLLTKGSVPLPSAFGEITIGVPGNVTMIGLRCEKWIYVHESNLSGGSLLLRIRNGENGGGAPVQYWAFGPAPGGLLSNCGVEIFDASAQRVFHSDLNYWNYIGFLQSISGSVVDQYIGSIPLVCQLGQSTYISMYNEIDAYTSITYFRTIGNRVTTKYDAGIVSGNWPGNYTYGEDGASLLILESSKVY